EAAQRPDDGVRLPRTGAEDLAEHNDEDPEGKAGRCRILHHPADPRIERPQMGFERDQERDDEKTEPERRPTLAQDVEARARHNDTADYRTGRQVDGQPVQHVEEQGRDEEQREGARLDVRPHGPQRDVRTSQVTLWIVLGRNHHSFSSPVPLTVSTWWTQIA